MKYVAILSVLICGWVTGQNQGRSNSPVYETQETGPSLHETQQFIRSRMLRNGIVTYTNDEGATVNESIMGVVAFDCTVTFEVNTREITKEPSIIAASRTFEVDFSIVREIRLEKKAGDTESYYLLHFLGRLNENSLKQEETLRVTAEGEALAKALFHLHTLCGGDGTLFR